VLGYDNQAFCFCQSMFAKKQGAKMIYENGSLISFKCPSKTLDIFSWMPFEKRAATKQEHIYIRELQANYQNYQHRLIENRCRKGR